MSNQAQQVMDHSAPEAAARFRVYRPMRRWVNDVVVKASLVGDPPVYEPSIFPWTRTLEDNWQLIRDDAMRVWRRWEALPSFSAVVPQAYKITTDDTWRCFFLHLYGCRIGENCARVPDTARLVDAVPGLNMALFSFHKPGLHIPAHVGVTKAFLTCHLGLQVPVQREQCRIRVADRTLLWEEGKTLVFDDMHEHEVWNDTDEYRIILWIQFRRPMTMRGRIVSRAFQSLVRFSPIGYEIRDRLRRFDRRYDAVTAEQDPAVERDAA